MSCSSLPEEKTTDLSQKSHPNMTPAPYRTLLLDMDGVLAEVSKSYRASILETCHNYGATSVTLDVIGDWKARGGCNNDWKLSLDLINDDPNGQKGLTLDQVTETFEEFYQGTVDRPGLADTETLIPTKAVLQELRRRSDGFGIVTGRPRKDCEKFLKLHGLTDMVDACVCMEDGPPKPDPFPVLECCKRMGIEPSPSVVLVGDTPDDVRAALAAGCRGVAVATPEAAEEQKAKGEPVDRSKLCMAMKECGADMVLDPGFDKLVEYFPEAIGTE
jgi:HAD superfamily hydrolase (TIGR01548 family)